MEKTITLLLAAVDDTATLDLGADRRKAYLGRAAAFQGLGLTRLAEQDRLRAPTAGEE